jgi:hypothetical protein
LGKGLARFFKDPVPPSLGLVAVDDHIHVERIDLHAQAAPPCALGSDERGSRTQEWIEHDVAAMRDVKKRVLQNGGRLDGRMILEASAG